MSAKQNNNSFICLSIYFFYYLPDNKAPSWKKPKLLFKEYQNQAVFFLETTNKLFYNKENDWVSSLPHMFFIIYFYELLNINSNILFYSLGLQKLLAVTVL